MAVANEGIGAGRLPLLKAESPEVEALVATIRGVARSGWIAWLGSWGRDPDSDLAGAALGARILQLQPRLEQPAQAALVRALDEQAAQISADEGRFARYLSNLRSSSNATPTNLALLSAMLHVLVQQGRRDQLAQLRQALPQGDRLTQPGVWRLVQDGVIRSLWESLGAGDSFALREQPLIRGELMVRVRAADALLTAPAAAGRAPPPEAAPGSWLAVEHHPECQARYGGARSDEFNRVHALFIERVRGGQLPMPQVRMVAPRTPVPPETRDRFAPIPPVRVINRLIQDGVERSAFMLNAANAVHPGGGVLGPYCIAMEEAMCRAILGMFDALKTAQVDAQRQGLKDGAPYIPLGGAVAVRGTVLEDGRPADNVAAAAPDLRQVPSVIRDLLARTADDPVAQQQLVALQTRMGGARGERLALIRREICQSRAYQDLMRETIRSLLVAGLLMGDTIPNLCALGCGAFLNDPEMMARLFHEVLSRREFAGCFQRIDFSVLTGFAGCRSDPAGQRNFAVFTRVFQTPLGAPLPAPHETPLEHFLFDG